jgi:hypothetical protein
MKNIFKFFSLIFISIQLLAPLQVKSQGDFMDLLLLFVDEKYDICFHKSLKYTEKEKTKKHPLPYLYISMASFEMSQDHKYTNMYPKAFKTSLSYLSKYRKKDKGFEYKDDSEDFIEKIKMILAEEIENYMTEGTETTYGKAAGITKKICSIDPSDYGSKLLYGHLCILTKNRSTAKEFIKPSLEYIKALPEDKFAFKNMTLSQQHYLKYALIELAKYQKNKNIINAQETIKLGEDYFYKKRDDCYLEDNSDFISLFDELFKS